MRTGALVLVCAAVGCASAPPGAFPLSRADAAIRAADEVGADADPTASLYLALARHDLAEARRRGARGDAEGATLWTERAEIDAELATLVAREAGLREAVSRTNDEVGALQEELGRVAAGAK